jgi:hypothetical protein
LHCRALYKDIRAHPEIAFQEEKTAAKLAAEMRALGFEVTEHVGKTGLVAIYRNGDGPTIMVRTELDALPMEEKTGPRGRCLAIAGQPFALFTPVPKPTIETGVEAMTLAVRVCSTSTRGKASAAPDRVTSTARQRRRGDRRGRNCCDAGVLFDHPISDCD